MKRNALSKWLKTFLTHPQLPWIAMSVGMLLASPALARGWGFADDIMQRDMILASTLPETLADSSYGYQFGDGLFRGIDYPMQLGEQVELTGMQVTVISMTEDDRPLEAEITFTRILEDENFVWLAWDWGNSQYEEFEPPAVGETSIIPRPFDDNSIP